MEYDICKRIHDITVTMHSSMPIWPGNPNFEHSLYKSIAEGASSDVSIIKMGSHTGTHVDAPSHFVLGASTIDKLPIDILVGKVVVFDLDVEDCIKRSDLETLDLDGHIRVVFKTKNSLLWESNDFTPDFISFTPEAAKYLVDKGIKLIGIDYLSVGKYGSGTPVHHIFLEQSVIIVEGLDLSKIDPGDYTIICLPLKILDADGAPARVLLCEP